MFKYLNIVLKATLSTNRTDLYCRARRSEGKLRRVKHSSNILPLQTLRAHPSLIFADIPLGPRIRNHIRHCFAEVLNAERQPAYCIDLVRCSFLAGVLELVAGVCGSFHGEGFAIDVCGEYNGGYLGVVGRACGSESIVGGNVGPSSVEACDVLVSVVRGSIGKTCRVP